MSKYANLGLRAAYGLILNDLAGKNKNFFVGACDTSTSAGLDRFKNNYPNRYIEMGISEQNAIGVASGMALEGNAIFLSTFAPFLSLRVAEQVKIMLGYDQAPVCLVGIASGLTQTTLGQTHCCLEDIGFMSLIPNLEIHSPSNLVELLSCINEYLEKPKPTYIRLTGDSKLIDEKELMNLDNIPLREIDRNRTSIIMISTGSIAYQASAALKSFRNKGIYAEHLTLCKLKPLNESALVSVLKNFDFVFTIEEHNSIGGLGSLIANLLCTFSHKIKLIKIAIPDTFDIAGGTYTQVLEEFNLDSEGIKNIIEQTLSINNV